jgi:hypothetical protein
MELQEVAYFLLQIPNLQVVLMDKNRKLHLKMELIKFNLIDQN